MAERKWDPRKPGAGRRKPRDKSRFAPKPKPVREPIGEGVAILYGWHTVAAALANPRRTVRKIFATENAAHRLTSEGFAPPVPPEIVRREAFGSEPVRGVLGDRKSTRLNSSHSPISYAVFCLYRKTGE